MAGTVSPASAQMPQAPEVAAKAYLLMDVTSGQVLASMNPDQSVEPASLTKLMTAYIVFDALKAGKITLTQTMPVSERAWKMPGSRMFIDPKMQVPVEDLIKGMIVQSGNDATVALAEGVAGSVERFVELMNAQAKSLGMNSTGYRNTEGLTEAGHTTTARDLATLANRLMTDFPQYVPYYAIQRYRYPGTPATNDTNRNLLLFRDPSVDGLKTGHTNAAGYCLVATARRQVPGLGEGAQGQRRLISILLGASSENARAAETQKLLNWGYTAFDAVRLFPAGAPVATPRVWKGKSEQVRLGRPEGVVVSVPAGEGSKLKTEVVRPDPLVAPLNRGDPLGSLRVSLASGTKVAEIPLVVMDTVEESGVFGRAWDAIRLWIQ
ncbi:D-alanyl-D-alanine carboxypeptidase family protein [Hydrogenophaga sp.]|uniref:D-alanyl-D-alanine carboxypeptidase family protein n=1 Tax=Hydrogenophaga sp. TaxID=1904254 RepID=UPI0027312C29|nr:D-alanyl-D-alanine carboxypeptidase family protein [Hydrogenophaga sp.]MDP2017647.1 D-alanyl-D-alanine carboxypeptidase family protein [Hydrogenophaga sp.]MDP3164846.1 D-alanyl-D-alanine carboxypeptidase family protein [Hydrogenophaga sp.]MDP3811295.1 D-alanyl-D-alanine carboxypeptidase family protein [Hydrogenophaga sp.]